MDAIELGELEGILGQIERDMKRSAFDQQNNEARERELKRTHSHSNMFRAVNGHARIPKRPRSIDYYDGAVSPGHHRCPDECFRSHRSRLNIDTAKLMLDIETVLRAEEGFKARKRSLDLSAPEPKAMGLIVNEGMAKKVKRKKKQEMEAFLDWNMPELR